MELQRRTALKGGAAAVAGALTGGPVRGAVGPGGRRGSPGPAPQAASRSPTCATDRCGCTCPRGSATGRSTTPSSPSSSTTAPPCPAATTAWAPSRPRRQHPAGPQPRGHQLGHRDRVRPGHAVRRQGRRGHDHDRGDQVRRGRRRPTPASTARCSTAAAADAVGLVDHLRGDHQRPRRRPGLPGPAEHPARAEARLRLRGAGRRGQSNRQPITQAGRFPHEAVSFDPVDGILYLTEDNFEFASGFYRYIPKNNPMETGYLDNEGRLQMLAITGQPNAHLEARQPQRATYGVRWVDIDDPDPTMPPGTTNDQALVKVGDQGRAQGAALFSRLEGQVYDNNVVYFTSTQGGGDAEQDWGIRTTSRRRRRRQPQRLRQGQRPGLGLPLPFPDPAGPLPGAGRRRGGEPHVRLPRQHHHQCRRHARRLRGQHGRQLHPRAVPRRSAWDIALNRLVSQLGAKPTRFADEFAGSTFSPDGHTLFVNIQASRGMTFAIWGPWKRIGV